MSAEYETKNAVIVSVQLSTADHGCLSAWLHLDYGGTGQGFGGFNLFRPQMPHAYCGLFIWRVLEIAGVDEWMRLPGKTIRARTNHSNVKAIGHILKEDWFEPTTEFALLRGETP